jgi:ABC-type nitrate/sulfonate/bicarbonate transport system substrate-binding protein
MKRFGLLRRVASAVIPLALAFPGTAAAQKLAVGWASVSAIYAPLWVMKEAGLAKKEGLDTELVYIASSSTMAQSMLAGDVPIASINSQAVADIGLQGGDLLAIGSVTNVAAFYLMAAPEIKSIKDLKGKSIGITRFGASTDFGIRMLLTKHGLEPVRDVPILQIGGMPEIAGALSKKTIAAAPMSFPMAHVAQQAGMKILASLSEENIPFMHGGIVTSRRYIKERRAEAKTFLRAYSRAVHFMYVQKEETKKITGRYTRITDPKMLDGSLQYAYDFVEKIPLVKAAAFQTTLDEIGKKNPKAKQAKPEQFFDNSLVEELINEGFYKNLWREEKK